MNTRLFGTILVLACSASLGCASLGSGVQTSTPPVALGTYTVQTVGGMFGNKTKNYPLHEGVTAQTVLEESGQLSTNRNFEIDILRKTNSDMGVVKMPVQFDAGKHRVKFETDYAIHPGDRVVIRPLSYSPFEQVAHMMGPSN
jgi:hypothetical protein